MVIFIFLTAFCLVGCTDGPDIEDQLDNYFFILNLPANRWVKYHELNDGDWWRKGHAGLAYDSTRGSLLVFGSDTHGEDWDNIVHEFIPKKRDWVHHGVNAPSSSYSVNSEGYLVAGYKDWMPFAMHTYDGVSYDSHRDALVVVASADHTPIDKNLPKPRSHPFITLKLTVTKS